MRRRFEPWVGVGLCACLAVSKIHFRLAGAEKRNPIPNGICSFSSINLA